MMMPYLAAELILELAVGYVMTNRLDSRACFPLSYRLTLPLRAVS